MRLLAGHLGISGSVVDRVSQRYPLPRIAGGVCAWRFLLFGASAGGKSGGVHGAVIVAVAVVGVVEVAIHEVVDVIAVGYGFVAAVQAVAVALFVSAAGVVWCAGHGVAFVDG